MSTLSRLRLYWQLRGRNVIIPLWAERRFWRAVYAARHPAWAVACRRKRRARPGVGEQCLAHGQVVTVASYGEDDPDRLNFTNGEGCSWMSCCDPLPEKNGKDT